MRQVGVDVTPSSIGDRASVQRSTDGSTSVIGSRTGHSRRPGGARHRRHACHSASSSRHATARALRSRRAIRSCSRQDAVIRCSSPDSTKVGRAAAAVGLLLRREQPAVDLLKPNEPLAMSAHWDWALRTAMDRSDATHFTVHYDRRITKPGHLAPICRALGLFPGRRDDVFLRPGHQRRGEVGGVAAAVGRPVVHGADLTRSRDDCPGAYYRDGHRRFRSCRTARSRARSSIASWRVSGRSVSRPHPIPRSRIASGATHDRYVHYDRCVGIAYGFDRSTGFGFVRGSGGDFGDFMQWWGDRPWLDAAPIVGLNMGQNVLFHEDTSWFGESPTTRGSNRSKCADTCASWGIPCPGLPIAPGTPS